MGSRVKIKVLCDTGECMKMAKNKGASVVHSCSSSLGLIWMSLLLLLVSCNSVNGECVMLDDDCKWDAIHVEWVMIDRGWDGMEWVQYKFNVCGIWEHGLGCVTSGAGSDMQRSSAQREYQEKERHTNFYCSTLTAGDVIDGWSPVMKW